LTTPDWVVLTNVPVLSGGYFVVSNVWTDPLRYFQLVSPTFAIALSVSPSNAGTISGAGLFVGGGTNTVTATAVNGFIFTNWTQGGTEVSTSTNYAISLGSNVTLVANFLATNLPVLGITQSGGMTFLFWTNSTTNFALESTPSVDPPAWTVLTNTAVLSGGIWTVSNAWPDQTLYFQLISQ
jgi:hypothetical protein